MKAIQGKGELEIQYSGGLDHIYLKIYGSGNPLVFEGDSFFNEEEPVQKFSSLSLEKDGKLLAIKEDNKVLIVVSNEEFFAAARELGCLLLPQMLPDEFYNQE